MYNKALHIKKHTYKHHGLNLSPRQDLKPLLAIAKKSRRYGWLKEYDSIALQQAVINLHTAFDNFFNPKLQAKFPRFKRKHGRQSSYHCVGVKVLKDAIKIPKLSPIDARLHREIEGSIKNITLSRTVTGKYFASILSEDGREVPTSSKIIDTSMVMGCDLGLTHFLIRSDGKKQGSPRCLLHASQNLRRKQKALSRKVKGSKNRVKARLMVARCHEKISHARADFQHKLSRQLIDESQAVIVETLKTSNMLKNHRLARHIADAGWQSFVNKLDYKAKEAGKQLVKLAPWYASTKTCHHCGHKEVEMPLHKRDWQCPACHVEHDRDINAALNIKQQGIIELQAAWLVVSAHGGPLKTCHVQAAAIEVGSFAR